MTSGAPRIKSYEDLRVWQDSIALVKQVYAAIGRLPREERYALSDQMRRAAVSVPANIAEGQTRQHTKEFIQFLHVARASAAEVDTLIVVAQELGYLDSAQGGSLRESIASISKMISALIRSLNSSPPATDHSPR